MSYYTSSGANGRKRDSAALNLKAAVAKANAKSQNTTAAGQTAQPPYAQTSPYFQKNTTGNIGSLSTPTGTALMTALEQNAAKKTTTMQTSPVKKTAASTNAGSVSQPAGMALLRQAVANIASAKQTSTPAATGRISVPAGTPKTKNQNPTGYEPTYGPDMLYSSKGNLAKENSTGYVPTYSPKKQNSDTAETAKQTERFSGASAKLQNEQKYGYLLQNRLKQLERGQADVIASGMADSSAPLYTQYLQLVDGRKKADQILEQRAKEHRELQINYETRHHASDIAAFERSQRQLCYEINAYNELEQRYNEITSLDGLDALIASVDVRLQQLKKAERTDAVKEEKKEMNLLRQILANHYYHRENQHQKEKMAESSYLSDLYRQSQELRSDMDKLIYSLTYYSTSVDGDAQVAEENIRYLMEKYGLSEKAFHTAILQGRIGEEQRNEDGSLANAYGLYRQLETEFEKNNVILQGNGYDYDRMTQYEQMLKDAEAYEAKRLEQIEFAKESPGWASLASVLAAPFQGVDYWNSLFGNIGHNDIDDYKNYVPLNVYNMDTTNFVDTVRSTVANEVIDSKLGRGAYQIGMGVVDGVVSQAIGAAAGMPFLGSLISGSEAAAQTTRKIILQGGTNEQALWSGAAVGSVDLLLDSIPIERLLRVRDVNGVEDLLYNAAKQAGLNAGTNTIAELSHITADALIMKDSSQFALRTEEYRRSGMSKSDAQRKALLDTVSDVLQAGATGALSGFVMGMAVDGTRYAAANRQSGQQGYDRLDLLGQALEMPEGSESRQIAQELTEELETALTERGLDISDGYHLSRAEQQAMIGETVEAVLTDDAVSKLTDAVQAERLPEVEFSTNGQKGDTLTETDIAARQSQPMPNNLAIGERQFGHKVQRHAKDYGLDPSSAEDRAKLHEIIVDIVENATERRTGDWRGQSEDVIFHIKGDDVVITQKDWSFISILKGGINNARVKNAGK